MSDGVERATVDSDPAARPLPTWFVAGLAAVLGWCATAGAIGIILLINGWYTATGVAVVATVAAVTLGSATARRLGPRTGPDHRAALVAVGLALVFFVFAGAFHSEHLLAERDPATYIANGRAIARTHELHPKIQVGAFQGSAFGPDVTYQPNFFPMLPVLLALGWSVFGDLGLLLVPPLLGTIGLLACYALAARVLGTRRGLLAPAVLMLMPLQLWFARDAYSELVVQVVALGGLWLYLEARAHARWGIGFVAGCVLASSSLARIDALSVVVGAVLAVAAHWVACGADPDPVRARRVVLAFGAGLVAATGVALILTHSVAPGYIKALGDEYRQLFAVFVASIVFVVGVVVVHRARAGWTRAFLRSRAVFVSGVVACSAVFAWAYFLRPDPKRALPVFTSTNRITPFLRNVWTNWHYSWSLHWLSAYFGVTGLVAAFVGLVVLVARARRGDGAAAAVFLFVAPVTVAYLARPSITPDLPWAMRRYLPVVIPGIAIAIAVAIATSWRAGRALRGNRARVTAGAAVVAGILAVAVPSAQAAVPFVHARVQHGAFAAIHSVCRIAGHDSAVLVYGPGLLFIELPTAVWVFCGVPSASSSAVDLGELAASWRSYGKRLIVATAAPDLVRTRAPGASLVGHFVVSDDDEPERVFEARSRHFAPVPADIWLFQIPAPAG